MHKMSETGLKALEQMEGIRLLPYDDMTGETLTSWNSHATIGYGHLICSQDWEKFSSGLDDEAAHRLLKEDVSRFEKVVNDTVKVEISQNQFDALVMLSFNIGTRNFALSSVLKKMNDPSAVIPYDTLEEAWKAWNKSRGTVMKGLKIRREREWQIFCGSSSPEKG